MCIRDSAPASNGAGTTPPPLGYAHQARREGDDAPTERLPIYEAVLSQWFREGSDQPTPEATAPSAGSMPLESEAADTPDVPEDPAPAIGRRKARREAEEQQQAEPLSGSDPLDTTGSIGVGSDGSADTGGHILAGPHDPGWGSADVGWQAAEALVAQTLSLIHI